MNNLREIKTLTWDEVFSLWRDNEATMPHWIEHYKKSGYSSWDEWRQHSIQNLDLQLLNWKLFEILNPAKSVSEFYSGPFRAWIKNHYDGKRIVKFSQLAEDNAIRNSITTKQILESFPDNSALIGLNTAEGIVVIEGLHRSCALAVAAVSGIKIPAKLFLALADFRDTEIPIMGKEDSPTI